VKTRSVPRPGRTTLLAKARPDGPLTQPKNSRKFFEDR
jgi:hypothetical protein